MDVRMAIIANGNYLQDVFGFIARMVVLRRRIATSTKTVKWPSKYALPDGNINGIMSLSFFRTGKIAIDLFLPTIRFANDALVPDFAGSAGIRLSIASRSTRFPIWRLPIRQVPNEFARLAHVAVAVLAGCILAKFRRCFCSLAFGAGFLYNDFRHDCYLK